MATLTHTAIDKIPEVRMSNSQSSSVHRTCVTQIRDDLRATFRSGVTRPLEWRKQQLYQLARLAQNEANAICDALAHDFTKPRFEVMGEAASVVERALSSAEQLEEWAKPEQPDVPESQKGWKPT